MGRHLRIPCDLNFIKASGIFSMPPHLQLQTDKQTITVVFQVIILQ